jgi:hypothetical protein
MDGPDLEPVGGGADGGYQPGPHFLGGFAGEGKRHDFEWAHAMLIDKKPDMLS